ncbi:MAG TPA: DUF72 domain-containing protein [Thermoplasmata archaeon]|nr:DUF72 domain-containing protein [Thermoplasmata archaeon]
MDLRIGCSSWTSPAWKARFYPADLPDGERLAYYAKLFDTVEVDATYYAPPNPFVVRGWARKTPDSFRFTLKMFRDYLDPKKSAGPGPLGAFVDAARELGPKLGAILLQFPPWYKAGFSRHLSTVLDDLPKGPPYAVELRDASWFRDPVHSDLVTDLTERGVSLAWSYLTYVDVPPDRTADWLYMRFIGDHETVPSEQHGEIRIDRSREIQLWGDRLRQAPVSSIFVFFNNHFAGFAPTSANLLREYLGLPPVRWPEPPPPAAEGSRQRRLIP